MQMRQAPSSVQNPDSGKILPTRYTTTVTLSFPIDCEKLTSPSRLHLAQWRIIAPKLQKKIAD